MQLGEKNGMKSLAKHILVKAVYLYENEQPHKA